MRRALFAVLAAVALTGCVSMLDSAYDEQARAECDQEPAENRGACYDRIDQNRRDRDRN